ncbi:MAG: BACON domain-containing protein [Bacteroidales bacterium]|nr:BACON domain-containing protein [Bacteroidales bacterium]
MKKIFHFLIAAAGIVAIAAACNKAEAPVPGESTIHFTIRTAQPEVKTYITPGEASGKYVANWDADDKIAVFTGEIKSGTTPSGTLTNTSGAGPTAVFDGEAASGSGKLVAVYPSSRVYGGTSEGLVSMDAKIAQKPTATSFDHEADILASQEVSYTVSEAASEIDDFNFARMVSIVKVNLLGEFAAGETVEKLTFKTTETILSGRFQLDVAAGNLVRLSSTVTGISAEPTETVTIGGSANTVWLTAAPTTIPAGEKITFEIKTGKYNISKEIELQQAMTLPIGEIATVNLTINEEDCSAVVEKDYTGDWIIYSRSNEKDWAALFFGSNNSGDNNLKGVEVLYDAENHQIEPTPVTAGIKMHLEKQTTGDYEGLYTIKDIRGNYLYSATEDGSTSNYLKGKTELVAASYWDVSEDSDGNFDIVATKAPSTHNVIRFNYNSGSPLFSSYEVGKQGPVMLLPWEYVKDSDTPKFNATLVGDSSVPANTTEVQIDIESNVDWTVSCSDGVTADPASGHGYGSVTVSFPRNTGSAEVERSIIVSTASTEVSVSEYGFVVTQGVLAEGINVGDRLWGENWIGGAAGQTPSAYQASGNATTVVFGGSAVTYAQSGSGVKLYNDTVPLGTGSSNVLNLMLPKGGGWWTISGIPCKGVKAAKMTLHSNYSNANGAALTSSTTGVTISNYVRETTQSAYGKNIYIKTWDITFSDSAALETFELKFTNSVSDTNARLWDMYIEVTSIF